MPDYPQKYLQAGYALYKNRNKPFVKRILMGNNQPIFDTIENQTHLMTSIDNFALPSLQYDFGSGKWTDIRTMGIGQGLDESIKTNNFIEFSTPEEADAFAKNYHIVMDKPELIDYAKRKFAFKLK